METKSNTQNLIELMADAIRLLASYQTTSYCPETYIHKPDDVIKTVLPAWMLDEMYPWMYSSLKATVIEMGRTFLSVEF